jgi:2-polyprenyl-3-methyl-5-hydroxy-6-metoxy-1,4-benzoquinol methylase
MKTHFEHLLDVIPDLKVRRILDLGSGKGSFLIQCAQNGVFAKGIELNKGYIETSIKRASDAGVVIDVVQGVGESLPFNDSEFNFVNLCEVIEHVENPNKVLHTQIDVLVSAQAEVLPSHHRSRWLRTVKASWQSLKPHQPLAIARIAFRSLQVLAGQKVIHLRDTAGHRPTPTGALNRR